jgi:hypothetical protein
LLTDIGGDGFWEIVDQQINLIDQDKGKWSINGSYRIIEKFRSITPFKESKLNQINYTKMDDKAQDGYGEDDLLTFFPCFLREKLLIKNIPIWIQGLFLLDKQKPYMSGNSSFFKRGGKHLPGL